MTIDISTLDAILNPQTTRQAESHYTSHPPQTRIESLTTILTTYPPTSTTPTDSARKTLAATLLRREIQNSCIKQDDVSPALLNTLSESLWGVYVAEQTDANCKRAYGHCIAEICLRLSLLQHELTILKGIQPGDVGSLQLLGMIANRAPVSFWKHWGESVRGLLSAAISKGEDFDVVFEALCQIGIAGGIAEGVGGGEDGVEVEIQNAVLGQTMNTPADLPINPTSPTAQLGHLLPPLLPHLPNSPSLPSLLSSLSTLILRSPSFFAHIHQPIIQTTLQIAQLPTLEPNTRLMSLQLLSTLCETNLKRLLISNHQFLSSLLEGNGILKLCTQFLITGLDDDVEAWASEQPSLESSSYELDDIAHFSAGILHSTLHSLSGESTLPILLPMVMTLLQSHDWREQHAALELMEICVSSTVAFGVHVSTAVNAAVEFCSKGNGRVQFQAVQLLGEICISDSEEWNVRKELGSRILEALSRLVQSTCGKVSSHASLAIVSYCRGGNGMEDSGETIPKEWLEPCVEGVLSCLLSGPLNADLENGVVLIRGIAAVACIADVMKEGFAKFYGRVMPGLMKCVRVEGAKMEVLRGAALEAASVVGQSVGKECGLFQPDASEIMTLAVPMLQNLMDRPEEEIAIPEQLLLASCARIASVMEEEFAPFLNVVLPLLLRRAAQTADVSVTEESSMSQCQTTEEEDGTESITLSLPGMGTKTLTFNTTQMEEKAQAARAVYELASSLPVTFAPYVETALSTFLPLVSFVYSPNVRATSSQALSPIFASAFHHGDQTLPPKVLSPIITALIQQLQKEDAADLETVFAIADSLSEVLCHVYEKKEAQLLQEQAREMVTHLIPLITSCLSRRGELLLKLQSITNENEQHDIKEQLESEADTLTPLVDSIGYILKSLQHVGLPIFDSVVSPVFTPLLFDPKDVRARLAAVCLFDDVVEHCGDESAKYAPILLKSILETLDTDDMDLKQACIYGIAQITRRSPSVLSDVAASLVGRLGEMMVQADLPETCAENAVSTLASMVFAETAPFRSLGSEELLGAFLGKLPLTEDEDEAKICHAAFCHQILSGSIDVTNHSKTLVQIVSDALLAQAECDVLTPETCLQLKVILKKMHEEVDASVMMYAFDALSQEGQEVIRAAVAS